MEKVKMVLIWCIPLVLITVALVTPAIAAEATQYITVKIWPDQLIPTQPNKDHYQTPSDARSNVFYAPLDLPKGVIIWDITYYHYGIGDYAWTDLKIYRAKFGNPAEKLGEIGIADMTGQIIKVTVPAISDKIVRGGYRYYIEVESGDATAFFMGAKITYKNP